MAEMTLKLNSPITEEQWDAITDVDFEHTNEITFHTKHGKEVAFVKRKKGRWIHDGYDHPNGVDWMHCSVCNSRDCYVPAAMTNYCPNCGADMRSEEKRKESEKDEIDGR